MFHSLYCQLLCWHYKLRTLYGSLYLVHYLNQYACDRQDVSLFLHSSPCVNSMFPQITLAWDATAQIMPIFIRKMAHVWILLILSISQSISAVIAVFAMNQLCLSPNKVNWAFSCVHTFTQKLHAISFTCICLLVNCRQCSTPIQSYCTSNWWRSICVLQFCHKGCQLHVPT